MRNISNSEVTTFLSCKRQYNFAFVDNITPKDTATPLSRGTLGHRAFELYVEARLNSSSHEQAMKAGTYAFQEAQGVVAIDVILETQFLWQRYMDFHQGWPEWTLLGTEQRLDLPITDTLNMTIRYDLYVEEKATGKRAIGDYKFAYDFWTPDDHDLNGQMPKYITVMNLNNQRVDFGFLEEVRTRKLGKDKSSDPKNLWRRTMYRPSAAKKQAMLKQHVAAALEIEKHWDMTPEERNEVSVPVLNKHGACKFCNFITLCNSMNEGVTDLKVAIESQYVQNTYGYNNQQQIEDLL